MNPLFLSLAIFSITNVFAQTNDTFGNFIKSDGTKIKGTSTILGFEGQVVITNYTGGSDNTGTIEIEVPTGAYVADFRNLMNAAGTANTTTAPKPVATTTKTAVAPSTTIKAGVSKTPGLQSMSETWKLSGAEVNVISLALDQKAYKPLSKIILQDVIVQSVTDDVAAGKSKVKLKAGRIGWVYYTYDHASGKITGAAKSGWDVVTGKAWSNF